MNRTYVPFVISPEYITLTLDSGTVVIHVNNKLHTEIINAIKNKNWDLVASLGNVSNRIKLETGGIVDVDEDENFAINNEEVPSLIKNRIQEFTSMGLPYEPIIKFWDNLKKNPSYRARADLFEFLEKNGHPLTEDGCFIAYKRVRDDFMDTHSGKYYNVPGSIIKMPRELVDDDPTKTCSQGLHVANRDYAMNFYGAGRLLYCKVNPKDVVAIPVDYDRQKMRCCCYEVIQEDEGERKEILYTGHRESNKYSLGYDAGYELGLDDGENGIEARNLDVHLDREGHVNNDFIAGFKEGYDDGVEVYRLNDEDEDEDEDDYDDDYDDDLLR